MSHRAHPAWGVVFQPLPSWSSWAGTVLHPTLPPHHHCHLHPPSQGSPSAFLIPFSRPQHFVQFPNPLLEPLSWQLVIFLFPSLATAFIHSIFISLAHHFKNLQACKLLLSHSLSCQVSTNPEIPSKPFAWAKIVQLGYICLLNKWGSFFLSFFCHSLVSHVLNHHHLSPLAPLPISIVLSYKAGKDWVHSRCKCKCRVIVLAPWEIFLKMMAALFLTRKV